MYFGSVILIPADVLLLGKLKKQHFRGLGSVFGLFMASPDGLMGYGYEIRLHNGKSSGVCLGWGPQTTVVQTVTAPQPLRLGTSRSGGLCFRAGLAALERERRAARCNGL